MMGGDYNKITTDDLPPQNMSEEPEARAAHAAEEIAAWLSPTPLRTHERRTALAWFLRLRANLLEVTRTEDEVAAIFEAEGVWGEYCHKSILDVEDAARGLLEYALNMRAALDAVVSLRGDEPQGVVDAAYAIATNALSANVPTIPMRGFGARMTEDTH